MIVFPLAKINLGLKITGKRKDGFHDLETIFYPIPWQDVLEIMPADKNEFVQTGIELNQKPNENLVEKAINLLRKKYSFPPVNVHLQKNIPTGAGLGGGSSDAANTIQLLNKLFGLKIPDEEQAKFALALGSDCPFFLHNTPHLALGRGEILSPIDITLGAFDLLVIYPGIHCATGKLFSMIQPLENIKSLSEIVSQPISVWKEDLTNDFEIPVFSLYPELKELKNKLYQSGALYASLSGSGSSMYGIFEKNNRPEVNFPEGYIYRWMK